MIEPAPRVAVNRSGQAVAAWVDTKDRVRVSVATRPGRFAPATTLAKSGLRPSAAIAPDGTVTVVWEQGVGLRFARATKGKFGRSKVLAPRTGKQEDSSAKAAAQRDGSVVVVYESDADVRTVTLSPKGKPTKPVTLGEGSFGHDSVRVAPDGTLAVCCLAAPNTPPSVAVYRGEWQILAVPDLRENDEIETVYANATSLILGLIDVHSAGDLGPTGIPGSRVTGENNVFLAPVWAKVSKPTRGLEPGVAIDRDGHSVLVYQEKTGPQAFSRAAPVYASVAGGAGKKLTAKQAYFPTVRPLGSGALVIWQEPGGKWGMAIERKKRFTAAPVPSGPGPDTGLGEDFHHAFDLAANGTHAVLTWVAADGSIRVSELSA